VQDCDDDAATACVAVDFVAEDCEAVDVAAVDDEAVDDEDELALLAAADA